MGTLQKTAGDAPFFSFVGPKFKDLVDLSVSENIRLKERLSLQLRADVFNLFNRINFASGAGAVNLSCSEDLVTHHCTTGSGFGQVNDTIGDFNGAPGLGPEEQFNMQLAAQLRWYGQRRLAGSGELNTRRNPLFVPNLQELGSTNSGAHTMHTDRERNASGPSRRSFLRIGMAGSAALASGALGESYFAASARAASAHAVSLPPSPFPKDAVVIDANENPLGPCSAARDAIAEISASSGRYQSWLTEGLIKQFAAQQGLNPQYVRAFPGSGEPLHFTVLAFTSPSRSYVTADPGYEAGMHAAKVSGARLVKVPLTSSYAHDVKAMLEAAPDAGVFYVCSPNNPTGTLTPHSDIEYLVEHQPKGSVVLVDEAYIHYSDALTALDLVKADKDVVVLRTFSKIYGMAGLRCGLAIGRPDLADRISSFSGWNRLPVTAVAAAVTSLSDPALVAERKKINSAVRSETFAWLDRNGYSYTPSVSNFFMLDTKRSSKEVIDAMAARNVFIGRAWPIWPTHVRITVGTKPEMEKFQAAFQAVMQMQVGAARPVAGEDRSLWVNLDGALIPRKVAESV